MRGLEGVLDPVPDPEPEPELVPALVPAIGETKFRASSFCIKSEYDRGSGRENSGSISGWSIKSEEISSLTQLLAALFEGTFFKKNAKRIVLTNDSNYLATEKLQVIDFKTSIEPAPVAVPVTEDSHDWILNYQLK